MYSKTNTYESLPSYGTKWKRKQIMIYIKNAMN